MSVVILWVNGSEPAWLRARQQRCLSFYRSLGEDASHCNDDYWRVSRAREVGELLFLLRSLERNAPYLLHDVIVVISEFVRPPRYLRTDHPRLRFVRHDEFIPAEYRPQFSTFNIHSWMWNLPGISENFVYFLICRVASVGLAR